MEKIKKQPQSPKIKQTPVFLVLYIIFAAIEGSLWRSRPLFFEQMLFIVLGLLLITASLYLIKNNIARLLVFLIIGVVTALYNYHYALCTVSAGALLFLYKALITEEKENDILCKLYSVIFCASVIAGPVITVTELEEFEINEQLLKAILTGAILTLIFLLALRNMKKERRGFKKALKKPYTTILIMSVAGTVHSVISYDVLLHNSFTFFPWFLFLCVLIYENDACMASFVKSVFEKAEPMLNTEQK